MNGLQIDEDKFKTLSVDDQRLALFQNVVHIKEKVSDQMIKCNGRFKKLEREKWYQRGLIGAAVGLFGLVKYLK